jgi:hypothetical protein
MSVCPEELKLVALDRDDIEVVSAHVQDALVRVGDMLWLPREHRFVMALNRFDWMAVVDAKHAAEYRRCRTALRFDRVLGCLEAELADLGEVTTAAICPDHFAGGPVTA